MKAVEFSGVVCDAWVGEAHGVEEAVGCFDDGGVGVSFSGVESDGFGDDGACSAGDHASDAAGVFVHDAGGEHGRVVESERPEGGGEVRHRVEVWYWFVGYKCEHGGRLEENDIGENNE